jgi:hypothetical protein
MEPRNLLVFAAVALALAACNRPDANRTTSAPPGAHNPTAVTAPIVTPSAPPAPPERGPIPSNANTMAPGTDAAVAFADASPTAAANLPPSKDGAPETQATAVKAQEATAQASDTAAGDAAKKDVTSGDNDNAANASGATAHDGAENSPRHGTLTPGEESTEMPKAGQANNHSSTALEKDSGR